MDMSDLKALLDPVSGEAQCGPDLDAAGDPAYVELGIAAEWRDAKYVGENEVAPASAPNWPQLKEAAAKLLAISKDLRIAKHYVAALTYTDGLPGFASGVRLVRELVERYWQAVHPAVEGPDDDWRRNLVMELNAERGALGGLRAAPIAESRKVGRFSVRDIEVLDGGAAPAQNAVVPTAELLRQAIRDSDAAKSTLRHEACSAALADLKALQAVFREHQPGQVPEFPVLEKLLRRAEQVLGGALGVAASADTADAETGAHESSGNGNGELRSRADARRALDSVCEFLERTEPSHPAPLLIRRASRLLELNFMDIIRDIAPEAVGHLENLGGIRRE